MNNIIEQIKTIAEDTVKTITEKADHLREVAVTNGTDLKGKALEVGNEWKTRAVDFGTDLKDKVTNKATTVEVPAEVVEVVEEQQA